ncbi:MAG: YciI family protein [Octadecabacter sp.]|nr:YciI family protein [Octadecabacter sp.]
MRYMALIYSADGTSPEYGSPEWAAFMEAYAAAGKTFNERGAFLAGEALQHTSTATSVRVRGGKCETMDGPFAETKERLGGFYLLDCKDLDEAIEMAALIPTAKIGTIEVRPVLELGG